MQNRWVFIVLILCSQMVAVAQDQAIDTVHNTDTLIVEVDSVELRYGLNLCDTLPELADSIFIALKTKKFDRLLPYIASTDMLKEEFDSMDIKRLQKLAEVKHQYLVHNLRKQHIKMVKHAKFMRYSLRNMEMVKMRVRQKDHEIGATYGEITYLCKSGRKQFYITFLAIKIVGKWFIGDELRIVEL